MRDKYLGDHKGKCYIGMVTFTSILTPSNTLFLSEKQCAFTVLNNTHIIVRKKSQSKARLKCVPQMQQLCDETS